MMLYSEDRVVLRKGSTMPRTGIVTDRDLPGTVIQVYDEEHDFYGEAEVGLDEAYDGSYSWNLRVEDLDLANPVPDKVWRQTLRSLEKMAKQ